MTKLDAIRQALSATRKAPCHVKGHRCSTCDADYLLTLVDELRPIVEGVLCRTTIDYGPGNICETAWPEPSSRDNWCQRCLALARLDAEDAHHD